MRDKFDKLEYHKLIVRSYIQCFIDLVVKLINIRLQFSKNND